MKNLIKFSHIVPECKYNKNHSRFWISQPYHRNSNLIKQASFKHKCSNISYFNKQEFLVLSLDTQNPSFIFFGSEGKAHAKTTN